MQGIDIKCQRGTDSKPLCLQRSGANVTNRGSGLIASLANREVIEQAQGLVMERTGSAADPALLFMKAEALGHSLPLPDLARRIVTEQPYNDRT